MNDQDAIREAVLNYVEGWFEGNSDRMEKALHTKLAKRHCDSSGTLNELDCDTMVGLTKDGVGKDEQFDSSTVEINIVSIYKNIASVILHTKYVDYLHLAKQDGTWKILNVLWDFAE
ncbi:MAG: nuclear transport factor 2 family protein [Clostridia bacterium]|nr:nuclear transport factor 2 family protein [Clostridia bacterium]